MLSIDTRDVSLGQRFSQFHPSPHLRKALHLFLFCCSTPATLQIVLPSSDRIAEAMYQLGAGKVFLKSLYVCHVRTEITNETIALIGKANSSTKQRCSCTQACCSGSVAKVLCRRAQEWRFDPVAAFQIKVKRENACVFQISAHVKDPLMVKFNPPPSTVAHLIAQV